MITISQSLILSNNHSRLSSLIFKHYFIESVIPFYHKVTVIAISYFFINDDFSNGQLSLFNAIIPVAIYLFFLFSLPPFFSAHSINSSWFSVLYTHFRAQYIHAPDIWRFTSQNRFRYSTLFSPPPSKVSFQRWLLRHSLWRTPVLSFCHLMWQPLEITISTFLRFRRAATKRTLRT